MNWPLPAAAEDAIAFALTVGLEWPIFSLLSRLGLFRTAVFCILMNGVTWGAATGIHYAWPQVPVPVLEIAVIAAETALIAFFWNWSFARSLTIATVINLISWLVGTAILIPLFHE